MKTKIIKLDKDKDVYKILLEQNPFRYASGGQPADNGIIHAEDFELNVIDVLKDGTILANPLKGTPRSSAIVDAQVDDIRRTKLTRMHSAEHVLFKSLQTIEPSLKLDKIRLGQEESIIYVFAEELTWDKIFKAEELANKIIGENRPVIEHLIKKEELSKYPEVRIKLDRIKTETIRIIEIKDFDYSACSGTHVKNTGDIDAILITQLNQSGNQRYEVRFKIDILKDLFKMSQVSRMAGSILGCEQDKIIKTISNLKDERDNLKELLKKQDLKFEQDKDLNLYHLTTENYDKKLLIEQAKKILKNEKTNIIIINKVDKGLQTLIFSSTDTDCKKILDSISKKFNAKGGGKKEFTMALIENDNAQEVLSYILGLYTKNED